MKTKFTIVEKTKNAGEKEFELRKHSNDLFSWLDPSWIVIGNYKTLQEAQSSLELEKGKLIKNETVIYETSIESERVATIGI